MTDSKNPADGFNCDCSNDPACCAPSPSGLSRAWKTGIFTIVILVAVGISAYSLFWHDPGNNVGGCGFGAGGCETGCAILTGIPTLDQQLIGVDFGLVVIPAETGSSETSAAIGGVAARLMAASARFRVINLSDDDPTTRKVIDKYALAAFPSVVALGGTNSAVFVGDEITEETLWQASQKFSAATAACRPANSPSAREHQ